MKHYSIQADITVQGKDEQDAIARAEEWATCQGSPHLNDVWAVDLVLSEPVTCVSEGEDDEHP